MIKNKKKNTSNESIIDWELHRKLRTERLNKQILRINLGKLKIKFIFRHRFEKYLDLSDVHSMWGKWELGFWLKKNMCVGMKYKGRNTFKSDNMFPEYMVGVNLIWCKFWITVSWNVLEIKL